MHTRLYLKTLNGIPGIRYEGNAVRPSLGHTVLGSFLIVITIWLIQRSTEHYLLSMTITCIIFLFGFLLSAMRVHRLQSDIAEAMTHDQIERQTRRAYDGGNSWFPLTPLMGSLLGVVLSIIGRKMGWPISVFASLIAFGGGYVLAVGLMYAYWEHKFCRTIMVYKYQRTKQQ